MPPTVNIDFSEVRGFEPIPPGTYEVEIENVTLKDSKSSDSQLLSWELRVADGGEFDGRKVFMNTSLAPKALWKLKGVMESLGHEMTSDFAFDFDDETGQITSPDLLEMRCIAKVSQREYQGKMTNQVDDLVPGDSSNGSSKGKSFK